MVTDSDIQVGSAPKRSYVLALGVGIAVLGQGCVPTAYTYWAPSAEGGTLVNTHCGAVAPPNSLNYTLGNVTLQIQAAPNYARLSLFIPSGSTVRLTEKEIRVVSDKTSTTIRAAISTASYPNYKERKSEYTDPATPMIGDTRSVVLGSGAREYTMTVRYSDPRIPEDEFEIRLPDMVVDGLVMKPPIVLFRRTKGFGVFPVNC